MPRSRNSSNRSSKIHPNSYARNYTYHPSSSSWRSPSHSHLEQKSNTNRPMTPPPLQSNVSNFSTDSLRSSSAKYPDSFFGSIIQGFGFGAGSSIARNMISPNTSYTDVPKNTHQQPSHQIASEHNFTIDSHCTSSIMDKKYPCKSLYDDYQECINSGQECDILYDNYIQCIESSNSTFGEPGSHSSQTS